MKTFDVLASEIISELEEGRSIRVLYPKLKGIELLLSKKLGGNPSLPRCLFRKDGPHIEISTRLPTEFHEGSGVWLDSKADFAGPEDEELRTHLVEVLSAWIKVSQESAPCKSPPLTFDEVNESVAREHTIASQAFSEVHYFAWRRWQCFLAAYEIAFTEPDLERFARCLAVLCRVETFGLDSSKWEHWPKGEWVTFANYQTAGRSALYVAAEFAKTVFGASQVTKVIGLQAFDVQGIDKCKLAIWRDTLQRELRTRTLALHLWSSATICRDAKMLEAKTSSEFRIVCSPKIRDTDGPCEPNTWSRNGKPILTHRMRPTAYALVYYLWTCPDKRADIEETAGPVFGEEARHLEMSTVQDHAKHANSFFLATGLDWSVTTELKPLPKVCLVNQPPLPRHKKNLRG